VPIAESRECWHQTHFAHVGPSRHMPYTRMRKIPTLKMRAKEAQVANFTPQSKASPRYVDINLFP
jgi:hypothetical protein